MGKRKKEEEIIFDGLDDYEDFIKKRSLYMQNIYKKEAADTWEKRKNNVDYTPSGVKYAVLSDFNHN